MFSIALFNDSRLIDAGKQRRFWSPIKSSMVILLLFLLCSCAATRPLAVIADDEPVGQRADQLVYVFSRGRHSGVVIAAATAYQRIPELKQRFDAAAYLEFGWGDEDYYQAKKVTTGIALRAVFLPTTSTIQVTPLAADFVEQGAKRPADPVGWRRAGNEQMTVLPEAKKSAVNAVARQSEDRAFDFDGDEIFSLSLKAAEAEALFQFIENSFARDEHNQIIMSQAGEDDDSQFYQATGKYHLFNTCNKWTAKALRSAGVKSSIVFKITAGSVMRAVAKHERSMSNQSVRKRPIQEGYREVK